MTRGYQPSAWDEMTAGALRDVKDSAGVAPAPRDGPVVTRVLPTVDDDPSELAEREIDYEDGNQAGTFVISGPLPHGGGPGRAFQTVRQAMEWAEGKYGRVVKRLVAAEPGGRWALRVPVPVPPDYSISEEVL